jgi:hypothetical protein
MALRVCEFVFLDPELFLALVRPLINTPARFDGMQQKLAGKGTLAAFEEYTTTCVATQRLLEYMWFWNASPTGDIGFFVELLEWCGLMCELRQPGDV